MSAIDCAVLRDSDLVNDARSLPMLDSVLEVARRKSGNHTVRWPLEIRLADAGRPG